MRVQLPSNPSLTEIARAVKQLEAVMSKDPAYPSQKIHVNFSAPTAVVVKRKMKHVISMDVRFFEGRHSGALCYTTHRRSGYRLEELDYSRISSMSIRRRSEIDKEQLRFVQGVLKRIHPNAWHDLREKLTQRPEEYIQYGNATVYMKDMFGESVCEQIRYAFETMTNFEAGLSNKARDRSISIRREPNGNFVRAWFSSEYSGCGNGAYYLLINPDVATFREYD